MESVFASTIAFRLLPSLSTKNVDKPPAENVVLTGSFTINGYLVPTFSANYPTSDGTQAEPGDTVVMNVSLTQQNELIYPTTVYITLDINTREGEDILNSLTMGTLTASGNGSASYTYDAQTGNYVIAWNVTSASETLTINSTVNSNVSAGSKINPTISGEYLLEDLVPDHIPVEQTVTVKAPTNKNIILVLDVSDSMKYCVTHGFGNMTNSGNTQVCRACGKEHLTGSGSSTTCIIHGSSNMTGSGNNRYCLKCAQEYESRLDALETAAKSFVNSVISEKTAKENISITFVTFSGNASILNDTVYINPTVTELNTAIESLSTSRGTNMKAGIEVATQTFNSDSMLSGNVKNILVFLSDGEPTSGNGLSNNQSTLDALNDVSNLEKFAVGLGDSFSKTELLALVDNNASRVFEATDSSSLTSKFDEIAAAINAMQSNDGDIETEITDLNIYPITLSYVDSDGVTQTITARSEAELTEENHVTIIQVDGKYEIDWDVSHYPGCSNFVIQLGSFSESELQSTASLLSTKSVRLLARSSTSTNYSIHRYLKITTNYVVDDEEESYDLILEEEAVEEENDTEKTTSTETLKDVKTDNSKENDSKKTSEETSEKVDSKEIEQKQDNKQDDNKQEESIKQEESKQVEETKTVEEKEEQKEQQAVEEVVEEEKIEEKQEEQKASEKQEESVKETSTNESADEIVEEIVQESNEIDE